MNTDCKEFDPIVDQILIHQHPKGIISLIGLMNLERGPAIGDCRIIHQSDKASGCHEVSRLALAMNDKASLHQLPHGGGKSLLYIPQNVDRTMALRWFSDCLNELGGKYITAIDSGTTPEDMDMAM